MLGEEDAFREFIREHGPRVRGHLDCVCGNRTDLAEDAFNIALANVWKNAGTYDESKGPLGPWFLRIATNALKSLHRKENRHSHDELTDDSPIKRKRVSDNTDTDPKRVKERETARQKKQAAARQVINNLPPRQRDIMWKDAAHPNGQVPVADLAAEFGTSEGAIKTARSKARATVKKEMIRLGFYSADQR